MDITKFDFTKFSKEKWEKVLERIVAINLCTQQIASINNNGNNVCVVVEEKSNNKTVKSYWFNLVNVTDSFTNELYYQTKFWRMVLKEEFGEAYIKALKSYLNAKRKKEIASANNKYESETLFL